MVGLVDYGSGSDSESEVLVASLPKKQETKAPVTSSSQPKPPPKKKIGIALPTLSNKPNHDEDDSIDDRPTKKPRIGSGKSSLLGMLPAPKTNTPVAAPKQRLLGGGGGPGLVFDSSSRTEEPSSSNREPPLPSDPHVSTGPKPSEEETVPEPFASKPPAKPFLLPPSLQKKRANVSLEETSANTPKPVAAPPKPPAPAVDFFGLTAAISTAPKVASSSSSILPSAPSLSAAPVVPEEQIPEPKPSDPYPGYYQKPNGEWAQYEVEYYMKFQKKWQAEYDAHVRALEKGAVKGFEDYDAANAQEIDPVEEMEQAKKQVQEREERKALTKGAGAGPSEPKMKITVRCPFGPP
jgi:hypothetical protein